MSRKKNSKIPTMATGGVIDPNGNWISFNNTHNFNNRDIEIDDMSNLVNRDKGEKPKFIMITKKELELKLKLTMACKLLRDLADIQNGPPLIQHQKEWEDTMEEVYEFLNQFENEQKK